jgi:hypothetical protein
MRPSPRSKGFGRALLLAGLLVVGTSAMAYGSGPGRVEKVVVGEGDTLWSIAAARYPDDPREHVDQIIRINHLHSPLLQPGQALQVPDE